MTRDDKRNQELDERKQRGAESKSARAELAACTIDMRRRRDWRGACLGFAWIWLGFAWELLGFWWTLVEDGCSFCTGLGLRGFTRCHHWLGQILPFIYSFARQLLRGTREWMVDELDSIELYFVASIDPGLDIYTHIFIYLSRYLSISLSMSDPSHPTVR